MAPYRSSSSSMRLRASPGKPTLPGSFAAAPIRSSGSRNHGSRITAVHVKDIAPSGQNTNEDGWADVGYGTVDWKALTKMLKGTPASYFIMEHDNPSDDERFARRSIATLKAF